MSSVQIEQYALGWNQRYGFGYRVKLVGNNWGNWVKVSSSDFAAFAALFNKGPLYAHPGGSVTSGAEPIGD